jgi:hypothetical protein
MIPFFINFLIDMIGSRLPEAVPSRMQDRSSLHGSMSDAAAGARTCILADRYPTLFSTSTSLKFADFPYANPGALAI